MARGPRKTFDEKDLTRGEIRKLNALRKSLGERIADKAFAEWLASRKPGPEQTPDRNAQRIVEALQPVIERGQLRIRRGGYLVRRGRGRVIVEPAEETPSTKTAAKKRAS